MIPERVGNCRVLGEIGSGGMAVVLKAIQEPLERTVAIKALKPTIAIDSQFAKRFEREAHFMAALQHENILHVLDFVKGDGSMYIVMEYVPGIDLYDLLERSPRLPVEVAAIIALQTARALDYAHFRGVIHRDIKPANIMISRRGEVKLMDFGIARDDTLTDLTETGTGLGTPSYMSPEQILGDKLDFRSDIFSLGIVLYQMVTGRKPFIEDDARTVMQKIRLDRYTPPRRLNPHVPRALERILQRCMEKAPANRYPTTQALIDDLVELLAARVTINHSARLVMYLRDHRVITESEADEILSAGALRGTRAQTGDRSLLRTVSFINAGLLAAAVVGGTLIQRSAGAFSREDGGSIDRGATGVFDPPSRAGRIFVVADPWANVYVDGEHVGTTPMARPIYLSPGRHYVKLVNPYRREEQRVIETRASSSTTLRVTLAPLQTEDVLGAP